jgi:hypothetical protein
MLPVGWLVFAVVAAVLLSSWITFTITRLDRLHARVDAALAALDAQLVRRAAALAWLVDSAPDRLGVAVRKRTSALAQSALAASGPTREVVENDIGKVIAELSDAGVLLPAGPANELAESSRRVLLARRFYNDAVRDTRALRSGRMPRLLRLAGHRPLPQFFDIDDSVFQVPDPISSGGEF